MAELYVIDLVNVQLWIIAPLREIPWVFSITSRGLELVSNNSSLVISKNIISARNNDVQSSSLVLGLCHLVGSQWCKPTEMGHVPKLQHSAELYGWNTSAFIYCLCILGAVEEYCVTCPWKGAAKGILETVFGNTLLAVWFTCLKKISRVRNTCLVQTLWKVNLTSLAEFKMVGCKKWKLSFFWPFSFLSAFFYLFFIFACFFFLSLFPTCFLSFSFFLLLSLGSFCHSPLHGCPLFMHAFS